MIIYNVTVSVDEPIEKEWVQWMKDEHIPEVLATGLFLNHRILKLLNDSPDVTGITYAIQYDAESIGHLDEYLGSHATVLREKHMQKYGSRTVAFRTVLEVI
jgi:hypothetical protein